jgi:hypothetical protein
MLAESWQKVEFTEVVLDTNNNPIKKKALTDAKLTLEGCVSGNMKPTPIFNVRVSLGTVPAPFLRPYL